MTVNMAAVPEFHSLVKYPRSSVEMVLVKKYSLKILIHIVRFAKLVSNIKDNVKSVT